MQLVFDQQEEDYGSQNDEYPQNVSQEDSSNCEYDDQDYVEVDAEINIDELQGKLALVQNYEDNAAW